jgi:drug/metabolite transporter (DMT)-like permease
MQYIVFILFTVITNAAAQLMLKYGMVQLGPISFAGVNPVIKILQIVFSPWVFLGLSTFVISMASHLYVLSKVELYFAYPFLSLAYVAVAVFAYFVFREDLNAWRIAGIAFICVGTVLIAQSGMSGAGMSSHDSQPSLDAAGATTAKIGSAS